MSAGRERIASITRIIAATNRPPELTGSRAVPGGPVLPAERRRDSRAAAARPRGRHPRARRYFLDRHRQARGSRCRRRRQDALRSHEWPGNVRELERLIERAVALASTERDRARRSAAAVRGDYEESWPGARAGRHDSRVGEPLRAAGVRALRRNKRRHAACSTSATTRCRRICATPIGGRVNGAVDRRGLRSASCVRHRVPERGVWRRTRSLPTSILPYRHDPTAADRWTLWW